MSQFYARYVPPTIALPDILDRSQSQKRKRNEAEESQIKEKQDKRKKIDIVDNEESPRLTETHTNGQVISKRLQEAGQSVLSKYSVSAAATQNDTLMHKHRGAKDYPETDPVESANLEPKSKRTSRKEKRTKANLLQENAQEEDSVEHDHDKKHAKLLSKFTRSKAKSSKIKDAEPISVEKPVVKETHGLEPIPQPQDLAIPKEKPNYSTLPTWQNNAIKVIHKDTRNFDSFGLSNEIVERLQKAGITNSFPIQTTVLPLLLPGEAKTSGDVCVSAATGSGKTLAYVLPLIEDLKQYPITRLRGVIIVPTRELVKQVRQLCDICIAGTRMKIATAAGSKSLKDEQSSLMLEEEVYDPDEYAKQQHAPIDWSTLSIEQLVKDSNSQIRSIDHVKRFRSKVDILIATPGRLVDHLQSTTDFNLDHVQWLVVDEADRLLNESYQEWVDIVVPALESHTATKHRDELLRQMRMKVPERVVQKVLLSATMTRDISKLNSLGLVRPMLVILGHPTLQPAISEDPAAFEDLKDSIADQDGAFHLPESLSESVIPVTQGSDKPLYLLKLVRKILKDSPQLTGTGKASKSLVDSSSDSDSSSATTDSTSSSGSDTDEGHQSGDFRGLHSPGSSSPVASRKSRALIFTRSTSSAERLSRLLALLSPNISPLISTLTRSTASSSASRQALQAFRSGRTAILIATDRASRGLDIPDLEHVISYDVPSSALTYVHRVGRTARAGKEGTAWTLVEHREGAWFWREIGGKEGKNKQVAEVNIVRKQKPHKVNIELDDNDVMKLKYEEALKQLGEEVRG